MALTETSVVVPAIVADDGRSYVDWPAIFAGTLLATAISLVLLTFGSAVGLSLTSAYEGQGITLMWFSVAAVLWLLWVQVSSFMAGGYLTGRLRRRHGDTTEHESDIRDGSHGLTVWAFAVLIGAFIALSGISGALTAATSAISAVGSTAATATAAAVGADSNDLLIDRVLRPAAAAPTQSPAQAGVAPDDVRGEIGRVLVSALGDGELNDADRQYLVSTVAARAGIPEVEAQQRIDQLVEQAKQIEADAREAADHARRLAMLAAFMTAASLLISAGAAYYGAVLGGNHRDKQVVVAGWSRRL